MSFVYVYMIELTVFDEEEYERPYVMLDRQFDIVRVVTEPLGYLAEIDMIDAWFKLNPFGLCGVSDDTLGCAAKLIGGDDCVYLRYDGWKATLNMTMYKQEVCGG